MQLAAAQRAAQAQLAKAGFDSAAADAALLLGKVTGYSRVGLMVHDTDELSAGQMQAYQDLLDKRMQGWSCAVLLGHKDFWDISLKVNQDVLVPRPDTETLVEKALSLLPLGASVLDLGTGSGAIILALKHQRPDLKAYAGDVSAKALAVAKDNAARLQLEVEFRLGSWFEPWDGCVFDAVISNPPYIASDDHHLKADGVRFEPHGALISGPDGLLDLKQIIAAASVHLKDAGFILLEHGYDQGAAVRSLLTAAGFARAQTIQDLGSNDRAGLAFKIQSSHQ